MIPGCLFLVKKEVQLERVMSKTQVGRIPREFRYGVNAVYSSDRVDLCTVEGCWQPADVVCPAHCPGPFSAETG